jgi:hypothetical protein
LLVALALLQGADRVLAQPEREATRSVETRAAPVSFEPTAPTSEEATRVALVIGNSAYRYLSSLRNAVADARDVCDALTRLGFSAACHYDLRDRRALRETVQGFFSKLGRKHTVVFYYAGHGVQVDNENYLLPTHINPHSAIDVEEDGMSLSYVKRQIELANSGPNLVILDACSDRVFTDTPRWASRGLARADPPFDTLLVYATAPNEGALDDAGKNGLFAKHLLMHMEKPGLSVEQVMATVAEHVEREARALRIRQVPFRNSSLTDRFCLAGCDGGREATDEATRKLMAELSTLKSKDELQKRELEAIRIEVEAMRETAHRNDVARQSESVALQAQIVRRDRDIVRLQERIDVLGTSTRMANENWTELSALRLQIASMQEERKAASARLEQQTAERERERNSLRIRETELGQLRREVDRYRQQVSELQEKIRAMSVRSGAQPVSKPQVVVPSF